MIAIINTGEITKTGCHVYRLQINEAVLGTFIHRRSRGLAACLKKAAHYATIFEDMELDAMTKEIQKEVRG